MISRFMHTAFAVVALLCCASFGVHAADSPLQPLEPLTLLQQPHSGHSSYAEDVELADSLFYSDELQVSFRVNRAEMSDSAALVRFVSNCLLPATLDKGWHLDRIVIRGAASPEGPWENNRRLAQKRAQALSSRLAQLLPAALADNDSLLVEMQVVEDYQRLLYLLHEASDSLEEVVSDVLLEESGDEKRIKSRLMSHDNGRTWRYLLKRYFPQLRSARVLFVMTPPNAEAVAQFRSDMHDGELSRRYASTESPLPPLEPLQFQSSAPAEESPLQPIEPLESLEPLDSLESLESLQPQLTSPLPQLDGEHPVNARRELGSGKGASLQPESSAWHMIGICLIVALLLLLLLVAFLLHRIKQLREEIDEFAQMARRPSVMSSMPAPAAEILLASAVPESAPESSLESAPASSPESVPDSSLESVPDSSLGSVPDSSLESAPESSLESVPDSSLGAVPESSPESVPDFSPAVPEVAPESSLEPGASPAPALLDQARAFVEANMSREDFSPEELAAHLGLSESLLNRRIRKFTGDTPKRYILSLRMQRAAELLSTTDMSVRDIALACGFSDQSYFARMVKQCTGRTPSQHRTEKAPAEPLIEGIFDGLPE